MRIVPIKVFNIARTEVRPQAVVDWLRHLNVSEEHLDELAIAQGDGGSVTDPAFLIAMAAKRCYMSFEPGLNPNVTKVRKDYTEYLDNVLKSGHGSVLEHAVYSFAIEGVSRVFTGEMNRHRAGVAISEGSMRYIRFNDIPYWLPTSITLTEEEEKIGRYLADQGPGYMATLAEQDLDASRVKKLESQFIFSQAFKQMEYNYGELEKIWANELRPTSAFTGKKHITSMMRRIIGMGVATGGVWTMNIRAVRHIMALRSSPAAEEEILLVFSQIVKIMIEAEPMLCGDFHQENGYWVPKYSKV